MVRLYKKDLKKLKPGQWLWFIDELENGFVVRKLYQFVRYHRYTAKEMLYMPISRDYRHERDEDLRLVLFDRGISNIWTSDPDYEDHWSILSIGKWQASGWHIVYQYDGWESRVKQRYLAKVTRKEEPLYIAELLSAGR